MNSLKLVEAKNVAEVGRKLSGIPKQVRFATSKTVNALALAVQKNTTENLLPSKFTLRSRGAQWWKPGQKFGVNIKFANKETLTSVVGSQADWLKLHEEGGNKRKSGAKLAIPSPEWKPKPEILPREKRPKAIFAKIKREEARLAQLEAKRRAQGVDREGKAARHAIKGQIRSQKARLRNLRKQGTAARDSNNKLFVATMKSGMTGIFKRLGSKRLPLKLIFSFRELARIEPVLHFETVSRALVNQRYDAEFRTQLLRALADAR